MIRLHYNGHTWTESELLAAHASLVASVIGEDAWNRVTPTAGPRQLIAWLAVLDAARTGTDLADTLTAVNSMTVDELAACITSG